MMYNNYMDAMSGFWNESRQYADNNKVKSEDMCKLINITQSPAFNNALLITHISDINKMSANDKISFIRNYFYKITTNVFSGYDIEEHRKLFLNVDFLLAFKQVLSEKILQRTIDGTTLTQINNICYDLLTMPSRSQESKEVENIVFQIASEINANRIPYLLGMGLPRKLAINLVMSRFSSFDYNIIIKRINFLIITQDKGIYSRDTDDIENLVQAIKNIYLYLFMGDKKIIRVFQYFMLDVIPPYIDEGENWVTKSVEDLDSVLNLVMLSILEDLNVQAIRSALVDYAQYYSLMCRGKIYRFSLQRLSGDYPRITSVVKSLANNENIYVP